MLNELYHSLNPVAFSAGPITIYWYGIAYIVGAILTGIVMYRTQRRWGFDISVDDIMTVIIGVVFGLLIGARLFYIVFYGDGYYFEHPLEILATNHGGMSFHGGLVGFERRVWDVAETETGLRFSRVSPDGEDGYPGTMTVSVDISCVNVSALELRYTATSDKDTILILTILSDFKAQPCHPSWQTIDILKPLNCADFYSV